MRLRIDTVAVTDDKLRTASDSRVVLEKRCHGNAPSAGEGRTGVASLGCDGEGAGGGNGGDKGERKDGDEREEPAEWGGQGLSL